MNQNYFKTIFLKNYNRFWRQFFGFFFTIYREETVSFHFDFRTITLALFSLRNNTLIPLNITTCFIVL